MATTITIGAELPSIPPTVHDGAVTLPSREHRDLPSPDPTSRICSCVQSSTATSTHPNASYYAAHGPDYY